jgi:Gas vesicle protein
VETSAADGDRRRRRPKLPPGRSQPVGAGGRARRDPRQGLVIDAYVRVSLIGIELLTIDARIVIASVDTYLRSPKRSTVSI